MPELLMEFCRQAGEQLADPKTYPALPPGSLPDLAAREKLVKDVESPITQAFYIGPNQIRNVPAVISLVRADASLNALAEASLPGFPTNVALGMAMRYYAGFLEMAKALRYDANADTGGKTKIDDAMRAGFIRHLHALAQQDAILAAGAKFGWWGIKRPRAVPEDVFDNGIDGFFKKEYLTDYYHLYPQPKPPAIRAAVQVRAYEIWETEHRPHGRDWAHWFQAKAELGITEDVII